MTAPDAGSGPPPQAEPEKALLFYSHPAPACPFCKRIDAGEFDPTEDSDVVSFIPLNPVTPGHRLFVPRQHVETAATDPDVTGRTFAQAARWGRGRDNQGSRRGFNLITSAGECATQTVKHLHVHYVQRREGDGLHLPWTGQQPAGSGPPPQDTREALARLLEDELGGPGGEVYADAILARFVVTPHDRPGPGR